MKTPAIIASLTVVGSIAYATGSQGVASKQTPLMPSGPQAHSMQEETLQARMQMAGGCEAEPWFDPIPHTFAPTGCGAPVFLPIGNVDVNGDGVIDFLTYAYRNDTCAYSDNFDYGNFVRTGNQQVLTRDSSDLVTMTQLDRSSKDLRFVTKAVFPPSVGEHYTSWIPDVGNQRPDSPPCDHYGYSIMFIPQGWLDCDRDGDLDLIVAVHLCKTTYEPHQAPWGVDCFMRRDLLRSETVWFENTGFQHTNHVAADLNGDGIVDGNDLGNLLAAWGPAQ